MKISDLFKKTALLFLAVLLLFTGCGSSKESESYESSYEVKEESVVVIDTPTPSSTPAPTKEITPTATPTPVDTPTPTPTPTETPTPEPTATPTPAAFDLSSIPAYSGNPFTLVNDNIPYFADDELTSVSFESYSPLDSLGRCGVCIASIGQDLMPTEERGSIGMIKPSGWHTVRYDEIVDGKYLYNRCHLIGYQLTGENANVRNLITGTRYMNTEGMLPFENMVADYVKETGNHVMYRVTPIFDGDNLLASGVLMEAKSVEDSGNGILFCIYCYNVQPQIRIDYATGDSYLESGAVQAENASEAASETATQEEPAAEDAKGQQGSYVLNTNTHKFHVPGCSSVNDMKEKNRKDFTGSRDDVISMGYAPCKRCNP